MVRYATAFCALLATLPAAAQEGPKFCEPMKGATSALRNIRIVSSIPQDEASVPVASVGDVYVPANIASPFNFGFIGGILVELAGTTIAYGLAQSDAQRRAEQARAALSPLAEAARDFDFRQEFWRRLQASAAVSGRFRVLDIAAYDGAPGLVQHPPPPGGDALHALLELRTDYALTPDLRRFSMATHAELRTPGEGKVLYRCVYAFLSPPLAEVSSDETAVAAWAREGALLYRAAVRIGIEQTLRMLRLDLASIDSPRAPGGVAVSLPILQALPGGPRTVSLEGTLVEREGGVLIGRDQLGTLRAMLEGETFQPPEALLDELADTPAARGEHSGKVTIVDVSALFEPVSFPRREAKHSGTVTLGDLKELLQ